MYIPAHISTLLRAVYFGGNWTDVNLKDTLAGVSWQQATAKIQDFNTIAVLVFHINYYVEALLKVLNNAPLDSHDKYSFNVPPIESQEDWDQLLHIFWTKAETLVQAIEQLQENKLEETFVSDKYGNYYRNLHGVIEHTHYHLGQIVLLKKML